jgi:GLPGLI family protein
MKTKHILFTVLLLLFSAKLLVAQTIFKLDRKTSSFIDKAQIECIYQYTVNAPLKQYYKEKEGDRKVKVIFITLLQINSSVSKFWDWHSFKKDSIIYASATPLTAENFDSLTTKYYIMTETLYLPVILKNYPKGKLTVTDEIVANDYIYTENKTEHNWELKDDTMTVCGYRCNKAVCSFGGREWTAWYTPDITISDGPWKLYGLPGLILKAQDSTNTHAFEAMTIRKSDQPIYSTKNRLLIKTKKKEFIRNKNKFEEDPGAYFRIVPVKGKPVGDNMLLNGKRCCMRRTTDYCPLELE